MQVSDEGWFGGWSVWEMEANSGRGLLRTAHDCLRGLCMVSGTR
jgi:hypothetical protein